MNHFLVYVTTSTEAEAKNIGHTVVSERLAACANVIPAMWSIYWWEEKIQTANEALLLLKTTDACRDKLTARIKELHSYDCPCIVAVPIVDGNPAFLQWIGEATKSG